MANTAWLIVVQNPIVCNMFVRCRLAVLTMADSLVVLMQNTSVPHANQHPDLTAVIKQHT